MRDSADAEVLYLRAVEDCFALSLGRVHTLSPKDMYLAKSWWKEKIPLEAISAGLLEIIARKRAEGDDDPCFSLSYCRHAVKKQARLLARQRVGDQESYESGEEEGLKRARSLLAQLLERASALEKIFPKVAESLAGFCRELEAEIRAENPEMDLYLFNMESALLAACMKALPLETRKRILEKAEFKAGESGASGDALKRAGGALADKYIRQLLELPRLD